ncbi:hypothetical protein [uncultured Stenotrophomonas sp.]|uniref:hypothetical protein n=1 Tax=uncultured Stenotrophomonas sp. TaxID=165438 RepID=UPI0028D43294|nr:hypothetical protein [uncultured Stenotrophomonas sp.]
MSSDSLEGFNIVVSQPSLSEDGPKSNKPWKYLSKFQLTCQGYDKVRCTVYANGRQQVPIQINVEARDEDGVIVDVNHAGLYLYLCKYDDIDVFPTELGRTATEDRRFVYDGTVQSASTGVEASAGMVGAFEEDERVQYVRQFVTAKKVGTYKLAVRCRSPDKVIFVTNTPNPPEGKFDSWLLIDAREPVPIRWEEFGMSREDAYNNSKWDLDLYYIYFKDANLRIVDSVSYGFPVNDMPHYSWNKGGKQIHHVTYRANERRMVRHRSCADPSNYLNFYVNSRAGQATAARVTDTRPCGSFHSDPRVMGYIDQYGNESKVMIKGSSNGNTLHLRDPNSKDDETIEDEIGE